MGGYLKKQIVIDMLCRHFIEEESVDILVKEFVRPDCGASYIRRILSIKQGEDTCRRPNERKLFKFFMDELGLEFPVENYICPKDARRKPPPSGPTLGLDV